MNLSNYSALSLLILPEITIELIINNNVIRTIKPNITPIKSIKPPLPCILIYYINIVS